MTLIDIMFPSQLGTKCDEILIFYGAVIFVACVEVKLL